MEESEKRTCSAPFAGGKIFLNGTLQNRNPPLISFY